MVKLLATTFQHDQQPTVSVISKVYEDNQACLTVASSTRITPRTKHIATKYHFFRSKIGKGTGIELLPISTDNQVADIFTKGLPYAKFAVFRKRLMGW